ncbi:MAG: hypothetical protein DMF83_00860 [Acidobacteria bacterium]|nr:MAG: hypothetical protein DMF83_00860 [Acidobacteriota bacterium]
MKTPESDLPAIEAEARRVASSAKGLADSLGQALPRLREDLRAVRAEAETLRAALQEEKRLREARQPPPMRSSRKEAPDEEAEAAGALLAAPFRVSAKAAAAARSDPLAALSVQVAKALSPDASPVDRARLIAMAFAASQGDLETFWAARRQRKAVPGPIKQASLRKG